MEIPQSLLEKYNSPIPRYTSYPPANHFREFSEAEYSSLLSGSNEKKPRNIAFYIHIPFCKKICFYCGCNSCSMGKASQVDAYLDALKKEIGMVSKYIDRNRPVSQIHYGGGTPNAIDISRIRDLNELFFSQFTFIENPEIAIECNPAYLSHKDVDMLIAAGFTRFSLGIQDFDEKVLKAVNRDPSAIPPADLFRYIKSRKESISVNFDFIYGLPGQTASSFTGTLNKAAEIKPDRLVTFSYAHVPWLKKHQLILEKRGLPASSEKMEMFLTGYSILKNAGYKPLGLDHYVLPEDDLYKAYESNRLHRNFQGYCTKRTTGQVYAFGVTGISQFEEGYAQNIRELDSYISCIENGNLPAEKGCMLSPVQKITREVIDRLMCNKKLNFTETAQDMGISVQDLRNAVNFREERLETLIGDKLAEFDGNELKVTEKGSVFIRNIAVTFDPEYQEKNQTYSRNV
jgi:oxygen-independent coproporphyrinogen-3 oxidase